MGLKVFIGSSGEAKKALNEVALWVENAGHTPQRWTDNERFLPGNYIFDELIDISKSVDAAILIFNEDDVINTTQGTVAQARDNVLIEYGLFAARLGVQKTIICRQGSSKIASDLQGIIYCDLSKSIAAEQKISNWLNKITSNSVSKVETTFFSNTDKRKTTLYRQYLGKDKSSWKENVLKALPTTDKATFMWPGGYFPFSKLPKDQWPKVGDEFVVGFRGDEYLLSGTTSFAGHKELKSIIEEDRRVTNRVCCGFENYKELIDFVKNSNQVGSITIHNIKKIPSKWFEDSYKEVEAKNIPSTSNLLIYKKIDEK
ncbi:nucleotide-binding protein [Saccharibacillus sp. CPCC 101409]|uniref:nucleotide-binding protein n=1 Tax=Saccharibacillus sp. CPCC 101409 TaxID=3058041 RepID=UPI0026735FC9|nr:nucleotide-binding protein [Saccharibacillus sp. CPCC 101409]MDO3409714.1 nucleotide-binding protein [Saccharibacillus sp. CPCC 101409]